MYHRECCDVVPSPNFSYAYLMYEFMISIMGI